MILEVDKFDKAIDSLSDLFTFPMAKTQAVADIFLDGHLWK